MFASVRKRSQASAAENRRETQNCRRWRLRVSKALTVTGTGGVLVAKCRTVVTFGLALGPQVTKVSTVTGIGGVVVAKCRTVALLDLVAKRRREERRGEDLRLLNL